MRDEDFFDEFDAATRDVSRASHQSYADALRRWFFVLDDSPLAKPVLYDLEKAIDAQSWFNEYIKQEHDSSSLAWPMRTNERLGLQLGILRLFAANKEHHLEPFGRRFYRHGPQNFHAVTSNITTELFQPVAEDLRRRLVRATERTVETEDIPASDRSVRLDHNQPSYEEAIAAIDRLEELVKQTNDYDDSEEKDQVIAELSAGRRLLQAVRVRLRPIGQVIGGAVRTLIARFGTGLINQAAHEVWDKLTGLLGSGWHWPF